MSDKNDTTSFAWDSFSKTGKIGYYLFYRALSQFGEKDTDITNGKCFVVANTAYCNSHASGHTA